MIRVACLLALVALAALLLMVLNLTGATATMFSFVGLPAMGLALALYAFARWRAGGFGAAGIDRD
jgi:hypothetical protein